MKIFTNYYEAVIHCIMNDVVGYRVKKHDSRPNTMYNWYVIDKKGKHLKR
jgi:hypothetical protein